MCFLELLEVDPIAGAEVFGFSGRPQLAPISVDDEIVVVRRGQVASGGREGSRRVEPRRLPVTGKLPSSSPSEADKRFERLSESKSTGLESRDEGG